MPRLISGEAISASYDHQVGIARSVDADVKLPLTIIKETVVPVVRVMPNHLKLPYRQLSIHGFTVLAIHNPMFIAKP